MLKKILAIALSALCGHAWAQHAIIQTNNPIPRQGDELEVTVALERSPSGNGDEPDAQPAHEVGHGMFFFEKMLTDTGVVNIGPLSFTVNDTTYTTGVLTVRVRPKLPGDIREGIWITYTEVDSIVYIVMEQRFAAGPKLKVNNKRHATTLAMDKKGVAFAELNVVEVERHGLTAMVTSFASARKEYAPVKGEMWSAHINFQWSIYAFEKEPNFTGPLKMDNTFFLNFPAGGFVEYSVVKF